MPREPTGFLTRTILLLPERPMPATQAGALHQHRPAAVQSHQYQLTTPEEQHVWAVRWWWRKCRLIGACPPQRTLAGMMARNREAIGR